jgi:hypothetical protein
MANEEHVAILKQSVDAWNAWRKENPDIRPDLRGAILSGANLREADLSGANLREADLSGANLVGAIVVSANLSEANLSGADHHGANLSGASFYMANLSGADLRGANLYGTTLVDTNLAGADFTGCYIYGVSAWNLKLAGAKQQNLVITREEACLRVQARQRWPRHARPAALSRPQEHSAHRQVYRHGARPIQVLLEVTWGSASSLIHSCRLQ